MTGAGGGFSAQERRTAIEAIDAALQQRRAMSDSINAAGSDATPPDQGFAAANAAVVAAYARYEDGLPRPAISRCPFSGSLVTMAIDTRGLDGPWWNAEVPARPVEALPPTAFAVTGAVAFDEPAPQTPFVCLPGPGVPYVVPRLLARPEIKAVLSSLRIGDLDAYAILYFADPTPPDILRVNTWGLDRYSAESVNGRAYSGQVFDTEIDFDFELEFYMRTGRLLWIAPGDDTLSLRAVTGNCPYLGLQGRRYPVGIFEGKIWSTLVDQAVRVG